MPPEVKKKTTKDKVSYTAEGYMFHRDLLNPFSGVRSGVELSSKALDIIKNISPDKFRLSTTGTHNTYLELNFDGGHLSLEEQWQGEDEVSIYGLASKEIESKAEEIFRKLVGYRTGISETRPLKSTEIVEEK